MIKLNSFKLSKEETDINVRFTLDEYKWHCDIPVMPDDEIQAYLEAREDDYRSGIYRKLYPEAQITRQQNETELEAWERWIKEGCVNKTIALDKDGEETITETVLQPAKWRNTHNE